MANQTLDSFRRYVEPYATGVSYFEILFNAQETVRDFCVRTKCWQVLLDPIPSIAGVSEYRLTPPTGGLIAQVEEVFYRHDEVHFTGLDDLKNYYQGNWRRLHRNTPVWEASFDPGTISLFNPPDSVHNIYVRAAIFPDNTQTLAAVTFPDFIFTMWASQITDGILSKLYAMPNKPFSDIKQASAKSLRYERHVADVRLKVARSFGRQELETVPVFF